MNPTMDNMIEVWGGVECTINRVGDLYFDQLEYCGHYDREEDLVSIQQLQFKRLRYPVLWEKHQAQKDAPICWRFADSRLNKLRDMGITPIVGLVHHGSGPLHVNFYDGSFEEGLAKYAGEVAKQFPWVEYYTPVNEPLTTARFCGLYGHWYPHKKTSYDFCRVLISECKATVMAMKEICKINPNAKLVQTDDLGKCHSTPLLAYQAYLENERRWLSYELICGKLTPDKYMWKWMIGKGVREEDIAWFLENNFSPHICGFNYYKTSERFLDENLDDYPEEFHGGNETHSYADIHVSAIDVDLDTGPYYLLKEAWERLHLPMAITECHLYEPRDEQIRWFGAMWQTLLRLKAEQIPIKAITGWAIYGLYGWNKLVTQPGGDYEPGIFNLSSGKPKPTALADFIQHLSTNPHYQHPALIMEGERVSGNPQQPVLIIGKSGLLGTAFGKVLEKRKIHHVMLGHADLDIADYQHTRKVLADLKPWAVINTAGYVNIDDAEDDMPSCYRANYVGASLLAEACREFGIKYLTFSSDMVFDGHISRPYKESDPVHPINLYGESKASAEQRVLQVNPDAVIIRTSSLFSPWSEKDFVASTRFALKNGVRIDVANDVYVSPTYAPDVVIECLNLLFDNERGIVHLANKGTVTWAAFAATIAEIAGYRLHNINALPLMRIKRRADRPKFSALESERGIQLPSLDDALHRYFETVEENFVVDRIAV